MRVKGQFDVNQQEQWEQLTIRNCCFFCPRGRLPVILYFSAMPWSHKALEPF